MIRPSRIVVSILAIIIVVKGFLIFQKLIKDEREYLKIEETLKAYKNAEEYINESVLIEAKVVKSEVYGQDIYLQACKEIEGKNKNFLVAYYGCKEDINKGESILIDGIITGTCKVNNQIGIEIEVPKILATSIKEINV